MRCTKWIRLEGFINHVPFTQLFMSKQKEQIKMVCPSVNQWMGKPEYQRDATAQLLTTLKIHVDRLLDIRFLDRFGKFS